MSHQHLRYAARIRERGFRVTPQRQLILDAVCEGHGHTTLEEIYARVHARTPSLNRATVYRTLDFLVDLQLVLALRWKGRTYYEIAGETPHGHLICRACNTLQPLDRSAVDNFGAAIRKRQGFQIDPNHLAVTGLCPRCARAGRADRRSP